MIGSRTYELTNHLGNVLSTISDKKIGNDSSGTVNYYIAEVLSQNDYYPFGMLEPDRQYSIDGYRYGFNGKENDNEVKGEGNQQDYGMRIYDPRLGRFLSVDPISKMYPWYSPYHFAGNKPIEAIDLNGTEEFYQNQQSRVKYRTELELSIKKEQTERKANVFSFSRPVQAYMSGSQTTVSQNLVPYNTEYKQEITNEQQTVKNLKGATMDPWAGEVSLMTYGTAQAYIHGVVDHGKGIVEGIREGDYWKAAKNSLLLGLDVAPFVPLKGAGQVLASSESFLYRFDTRAPEEIMQAGGFEARGTNLDILEHAQGSSSSGYVSTTTDLKELEKLVGNQKGYIYKIRMQSNGVDVNKVLDPKSPYPNEMEMAVPGKINIKDVLEYKPVNIH
jgi:RHS repeat-associated protein